MDLRPTTLERAYQLAQSGECATVQDIKTRLRKERYNDEQIMGPVLLADLRRLMRERRVED